MVVDNFLAVASVIIFVAMHTDGKALGRTLLCRSQELLECSRMIRRFLKVFVAIPSAVDVILNTWTVSAQGHGLLGRRALSFSFPFERCRWCRPGDHSCSTPYTH